jgi:hypothetical protein
MPDLTYAAGLWPDSCKDDRPRRDTLTLTGPQLEALALAAPAGGLAVRQPNPAHPDGWFEAPVAAGVPATPDALARCGWTDAVRVDRQGGAWGGPYEQPVSLTEARVRAEIATLEAEAGR